MLRARQALPGLGPEGTAGLATTRLGVVILASTVHNLLALEHQRLLGPHRRIELGLELVGVSNERAELPFAVVALQPRDRKSVV